MEASTGIVSYGCSLPLFRLKASDIIDVWQNTDIGLLENVLKVSTRTVLQPDEDTITLGIDAAKTALAQAFEPSVQAIYLGTCTNPYLSRSSAAIMAEMLDLPHQLFCSDIQFSGKSGCSAMQIGYALVRAGMAQQSLIIGSDTISRHTAPGDLSESYAGAGAVAMLLGNERVIASIDATSSSNEDLADNIRPEGERYIRAGMGPGSDRNNIGIFRHMQQAAEQLLTQMNAHYNDFDFIIFQQPTESVIDHMMKQLDLKECQVAPSRYASTTGDIGAASPLLGLAATLDQAQPGQKILLLSYGFGAGSDAIALTVTDEIRRYQKNAPKTIDLLAHTQTISYAQAAKYEFKFLRPDYALSAYL